MTLTLYTFQTTVGLLLVIRTSSLATNIPPKEGHQFAASIASFTATTLLGPLLYMEHMRSVRPADLTVIFLLVSLACDAANALQEGLDTWILPATQLALKLLLVATESRSKQGLLKSPYDSQAPEQLAGILSRTFFWWINPILALGNRIMLSGDDLPLIDEQLSSKQLRHRGLKAWDKRARPVTKITLPMCLAKSMVSHFFAPVIPRLCLIFFRYAQPALISSTVHMLGSRSNGSSSASAVKQLQRWHSPHFNQYRHRERDEFREMSRYLARNLQSKQKAWNEATQSRISLTASTLSSMKVMKMLGLSRETEVLLQKLRAQELEMAKKVRWMMVAYNASANALGIFSPILTFVLFVMYANLRGSTLDAETAFTTTALLGLVTHPANMVMTIVPRAIGSLAAFERIKDYLVQPSRADPRRLLQSNMKDEDSSLAIRFEAVTVQSRSSSRAVLENFNFTANKGSITICAGAVGSGKTVLAQCILGEIPASSGTISVSSKRIAYCEQSPWLPSGTLKDAVCGFGKFEPGWYRHVVKLCCLDEDILTMPLGDNTLIGSQGLKLSGGQRQRLALARAIYARCEIVLLDDSFSALDHKTERQVVSNLVGIQGHFQAAHLRQTHVNAAVVEANPDLVEKNKIIQSQALEVTEAMADLVRSTGDFSLYEVFKLLVQATLLFSAQKLLTATLPICVLVVYVVQRVYLRTSRQLRLLQLESQSAVYSSFLESIEGVVSIRSFGWVKQAENSNMACLDKSQKPAYILLCLQLWLNIVLDLVIAAMAVILITLAVFLESSTTAGQIGMSLNIVLVANSTLLALVISWTNLEISLGAISRLKTLEADVEEEEQPSLGTIVPDTWPSRGAVEVRELTVFYDESHAPALKDINLSVAPGQYLVVCGRTGSTLLLALLRLLNTQSGSIEVDGINLSQVSLSAIREQCFITVTQDLFLLAQASLRFNLDPSESLPDIVIIKALERTGLGGHFDTNQQEKLVDILDEPLSSLPHMSTGQTQLFALTRAVLRVEYSSATRVKPILLLDEATSSVDGVTESVMRDVIKEIFTDNGHTVIEITHRLSGFEDIARGGDSGEVKVVLLSQGGIQRQGRMEDMLDFGKRP
ncbi:P-loop containing nucleoside triphosphate hydrolase protein [Fusarium oxysporum Fo47]|uniref:P-loop containing nucleoside triphosphate hydrolase protein n=1 Tax=Fusarium oxysporum Fo47 TaxID=660027 RepID=UPI0028699EFE|nr:P-loop containing nucleoside triphosphate hydrolase protein [Fusarium oxysporum Fo47]WJG35266.1 P-loop containing nucleoside triphosphate hydrolase protein [Fusarium oxysporum Fo47]